MNKKTKEKLLSIRLSADGLTFWTTALDSVADGSGGGFKTRPGSDSREQSIVFDRAFDGKSNAPGYASKDCVRAAAARCAEITGWDNWPVRVMPDTRKTALVPECLFDPAQIAEYLTVNNIETSSEERIVLTRLSSDTPPAVVIMAYDAVSLDGMEEIFGDYVWYTSLFDTAAQYSTVKHKKKDSGRCFSTLYLTPTNVYITIRNISDGEWVYCESLSYSTPTDIFYYMMELSAQFDILRTPVYLRGTGSDAVAWVLNAKFRRPLCV